MATQINMIDRDPEMSRYFETLPSYIQETIRQSGGSEICSLDELRNVAENLLK